MVKHQVFNVHAMLFYLVAGQSKKFRVLRGAKVLEIDVMPEASPGR